MGIRRYRKGYQTRKRKQRGGGVSIKFQGKEAQGNLRPRNETLQLPSVAWNAKPNVLYTVLMWDPDAPASSWIHLFVVNIPGNTLSQGQTLLSYEPPSPPSGTHRYYVTIYEQPQRISVVAPNERGNFVVESFVSQYALKRVGEKMIRVSA